MKAVVLLLVLTFAFVAIPTAEAEAITGCVTGTGPCFAEDYLPDCVRECTSPVPEGP